MTAETTHPLIAAYLRDLDLLLHGIEPGERAEVVAGVREHLDASAGPTAGDEEAQAAIAELGPPQAIADEAYAGRPAAAAPTPPAQRGTLAGTWVPGVVAILLGLAVVAAILTAGGAVTYTTSSVDGGPETVTGVAPHPAQTLAVSILGSVWVLLPALVIVVLSTLWRTAEKARLALLVPVLCLALGVLPWLGHRITGTELGIQVGAWAGIVVGLAGAAWVFWHDLGAGRRRAVAL